MKSVRSNLLEGGFEPVVFDAQDQDAIDLHDLMRSLWKGRYIVMFCSLFFGAVFLFAASQITPTFTSVSKVLLDPRERVLLEGQQLVGNLELSDQVVASEIAILRSNLFLENVIAAVDEIEPEALNAIDPVHSNPSVMESVRAQIANVLPFLGEPEVELSEAEAQARVDRLIWALRKTTSAVRENDSFTIAIIAKTPVPTASATLAGTIAEVYVTDQLAVRQQTAKQANGWIETRLEDLAVQVKEAEAAVEDYRETSFDTFGTSLEMITRRVEQLNDQLIQTRVELVVSQAQYDETARLFEERGFETLGNMFTSSLIDELLAQRARLKQQDAQWAERFDESHFKRVEISQRIDDIDEQLNREFERALVAQRNELEIARTRSDTMQSSLENAEAQYLAISRASNGLRQLERAASAARLAHSELLTRFAETSTQEQFQQAEARVIERALIPGRPSAPRPKLMAVVGVLIGFAIGLAVIVYRSLTQATYRTIADLEKETGAPVLSILQERNWRSYKDALDEVNRNPMGDLAENVKAVRNRLQLGLADSAPQSVSFLSALQGEGKTVMTALLANMVEKSDKLVVVIDCDVQQNSLQGQFQWDMEHDMQDVLDGQCDVLDAVYTETGYGFDVLANRQVYSHASDRISVEWLSETIAELKKYYDLVLVNCPAILPVADATTIAQAVDEHVLLVRHDETQRSAVKRCLTTLRHVNIRVRGHMLTRVAPEEAMRMGSYGYGYRGERTMAHV